MKKLTLILTILAAFSFTACQQAKDTAGDAANAAGDAVENAANKVEDAAASALDAVTEEDKAIEEQDPFGGDMSADEVADILKK